jgi:voltage-gated potassium channel
MAHETNATHRRAVEQARWELLGHIVALTYKPMIVLSFVWVGLLIVDFTTGLSPLLQTLSDIIWALFVLQFVVELIVAPHKTTYLRHHWLTALSLLLPALRIVGVVGIVRTARVLRMAGMTGSFNLLRLLTAVNRGMVAVRTALGRRRVGYVAVLTVMITLAGAAGMFYFESPTALRHAGHRAAIQVGAGLHSYGEAMWWTAMIMTTMGSAYWPLTLEGRILCWLLALYAFGVFGYLTAIIASFFIGKDAAPVAAGSEPSAARGAEEVDAAAIRADLAAMRTQLEVLVARLGAPVTGHAVAREDRTPAGGRPPINPEVRP